MSVQFWERSDEHFSALCSMRAYIAVELQVEPVHAIGARRRRQKPNARPELPLVYSQLRLSGTFWLVSRTCEGPTSGNDQPLTASGLSVLPRLLSSKLPGLLDFQAKGPDALGSAAG